MTETAGIPILSSREYFFATRTSRRTTRAVCGDTDGGSQIWCASSPSPENRVVRTETNRAARIHALDRWRGPDDGAQNRGDTCARAVGRPRVSAAAFGIQVIAISSLAVGHGRPGRAPSPLQSPNAIGEADGPEAPLVDDTQTMAWDGVGVG